LLVSIFGLQPIHEVTLLIRKPLRAPGEIADFLTRFLLPQASQRVSRFLQTLGRAARLGAALLILFLLAGLGLRRFAHVVRRSGKAI
jgi:hypothetical protein